MKRSLVPLSVILMVTLMTGVVLAETVYGDAIGVPYGLCAGHDEMTYEYNGSTYTTTMTGYVQVSSTQSSVPPQELYIKLMAWDGSTFCDYIQGTGRNFDPKLFVWTTFPYPISYKWYHLNSMLPVTIGLSGMAVPLPT